MEKKYIEVPFEIENVYETKSENGQEFGVVKGYGATFGNVDRGQDRILKGAFSESIAKHQEKGKQLKMLSEHWDTIGGWPVFSETRKGLKVEGNINLDVQKGIETYSLAKQGVLTDLSIGYRAIDVEFVNEKVGEKDGNDIMMNIRNIKKAELFEVSIVSHPMNEEANITSVKSCKTITDITRLLKSRGITNKETNDIIYFLKSLIRNDNKDSDEARNEFVDKVNSMKLKSHLNEIINKLK